MIFATATSTAAKFDPSNWISLALVGVTLLMAAATAAVAYHSWRLRFDQSRPVLTLKPFREHENPPRIGCDYWIAATGDKTGGRFYQHASGHMAGIVHYIFVRNVGAGIAKNVEIRLESTGVLDSHYIELNTTKIREVFPQDSYLIPIGLSTDDQTERVFRAVIKYRELFSDKYVAFNVDFVKQELPITKRIWHHVHLRRYPRADTKEMSYYKLLFENNKRFRVEYPLKNQFGFYPVAKQAEFTPTTEIAEKTSLLHLLFGGSRRDV